MLPSEHILELLRKEFSSRDIDSDGKLRLSEVHALFESLNMVAPNVLHLVMRIVLETSQSWEVTQSQQFSFADTVEIYQLLEKIVKLQNAHLSPRSVTSQPKFPSSRFVI